jgi:two-component sensor histidine kinase
MQEKTGDSIATQQLEMAAFRVAAVARVHRHFHLEEDASNVGALTYLRRLCDDLSGILGVAIEVRGENGLLPTTAIQPLGLIVNELVTNAAKHGAGKILVTYKHSKLRELIVCDQGPGFPFGFDPATSVSGLGMRVVQVLTKQLGGEVSASANPEGKGACFTVAFPGDRRT